MKIQFAIDGPPIEKAIEIAKKIRNYIDIIELGEGMIARYSLGLVTMFKSIFPEKKILADMKLMDDGYHIAKYVLAAGADIVTGCVVASEGTSRGIVQAAKEVEKESWLDLIAVPADDYAKYVEYINSIGPDYVCAHMASDISKIGSKGHADAKKRMIEMISKLGFTSKIVLSGGITVEDIPVIRACNPHHVNIGSAFYKTDDPAAVAKIFADA